MDEQPAFVIRDGVLFVPPWEWDSAQPTILGFPFEAHLPRPGDGKWATLFFANGWNINWAWGLSPTRDEIVVWDHKRGDRCYTPTMHRHVNVAELLRHVREIASRDPPLP